ncbi:MAG: hydrogenase iron-sulfur subunit [Kiritimatiellae bacterium]|nr:hydrogenase iron-sulfur subunit [Kiritimatiellia bacterium]
MTSDAKKEFTPEIVILYCPNSIAGELDITEALKAVSGFTVRPVKAPCNSKIHAPYARKILELGADGVIVIGCPNHGCHSVGASGSARESLARARELLEDIATEPERLTLMRGERLSAEDIVVLAGKMAGTLRPLGPNPLKGAS